MGIQGENAQFLVTSEQLLKSARVMKSAIEKAKKEVACFLVLLQETDGCFGGKAKEIFVDRGIEIIDKWQDALGGLHNNVSGLQEIADEYKMAEGDNMNVIMENGS